MSYLNPLRLHFAGRFQATVSTVNNDVTHFNNETFQPSFKSRTTNEAPNGWWNPDGDGVWRLLGCDITGAFMADGTAASSTDSILTYSVADSDDSVPAKIVDLDPQQQMVSTIFGLQVRIADGLGNTLMRGQFEPAAFTEIWKKMVGQGGDMAFGAMWQSVITVTEWGDLTSSPFLQALQLEANQNSNLLSIKFNVDSYSMLGPVNVDSYSMLWPVAGQEGENQFCRGRIVGTIGPASANEPRHFVAARQLMVLSSDSNQSPWINYCAAVIDEAANVVRIDLGNALVADASNTLIDRGALTLVVTQEAGGTPCVIGSIAYTAPGWYEKTAGIVEVPIPQSLLDMVKDNPLGLTLGNAGSDVVTGEPGSEVDSSRKTYPGGLYVRADLFVFRLSDGDRQAVNFYATRYGKPYALQSISIVADNSGLQSGSGAPDVATPASGLLFPSTITTDTNGFAILNLQGGDTANYRQYIDGQVYGVGYSLANQGPNYPSNEWNFISALVFDSFTPDNPVTWYGCMQPIFQQYANLYPVMSRFIDLGDYEQVKGYSRMLQFAFSLPETDANAMPVTRDLSPAKRQAILQWLRNPLIGVPPVTTPKHTVALIPPSPEIAKAASEGGKSAAMSRRIGKQ
jgi:hypothetical protein